MQNLVEFVTCQVPNRFVIRYRGKELKHHSLGQRASALLLYVLSQRQNDVIIIDQPEDDLDNQTISRRCDQTAARDETARPIHLRYPQRQLSGAG